MVQLPDDDADPVDRSTGSASVMARPVPATGFSTSHTYTSPGVYTVTFTVKNTDGVSDPHPPTVKVTVTNYGY